MLHLYDVWRHIPVIAGVCLFASAPATRAADLEIHVLNVGQGSATFIKGPTGIRLLVDGANVGHGTNSIRPYLQSIGVVDLDYAILTHWHQDHYGGMDEVFNTGYKPNIAAYDRGSLNIPSGSEVTGYLNSVSGVRQTAVLGQILDLGGGATLEIVAVNGQTPSGTVSLPSAQTQNNEYENGSSIGMVIRYQDFDCYIAGDLTAGGLGTANVEGPVCVYVGQVELAVASHHGSESSLSAQVVSNLNPSFVAESCGFNNPYGHPDKDIVNQWNTTGAARVQWCTSEGDPGNGSGGFTAANAHIALRSDGKTFSAKRSSSSETVRFTTFENPLPAPASGTLAIAEILIDPAASADTYGEWFELVNTAPATVDLSGMQISSGADSFAIHSHVILGIGERLLVGVDGKPSRNGNVFVGLGAPWQAFALSNSTSSLVLKASDNSILESLEWGGAGIPVTSGISRERIDLLAGNGPANHAAAATAWSGGDKGTPLLKNGADTTDWPAALVTVDPAIGTNATWSLYSIDEPNHFFFLGLSLGSAPGFDAYGFHIDLNPDPLFFLFLPKPQFFTLLDTTGKSSVSTPIPNEASLVGAVVWSQFLTFQFVPFQYLPKSLSNSAHFAIGL